MGWRVEEGKKSDGMESLICGLCLTRSSRTEGLGPPSSPCQSCLLLAGCSIRDVCLLFFLVFFFFLVLFFLLFFFSFLFPPLPAWILGPDTISSGRN